MKNYWLFALIFILLLIAGSAYFSIYFQHAKEQPAPMSETNDSPRELNTHIEQPPYKTTKPSPLEPKVPVSGQTIKDSYSDQLVESSFSIWRITDPISTEKAIVDVHIDDLRQLKTGQQIAFSLPDGTELSGFVTRVKKRADDKNSIFGKTDDGRLSFVLTNGLQRTLGLFETPQGLYQLDVVDTQAQIAKSPLHLFTNDFISVTR